MPIFQNRIHAAFLFDMDGTMLDSSPVVTRVWTAWADKVGIDAGPLLEACHGVQGKDLIRRFGGADLDLAAEMRWLQHAEMADVDGIVAIDGIAAFLERLDPEAWAIVTSAPRDLAIKRLGAVELPLPRVMVAAEDVARGKPDPEGFLKAAEMLGVDIRECLIFEDSPAGIAAGKASGAHVAIVGDLVEAGDGELVIPNYA
jgi:sugar-phosphatase